jgi:octaheme c-type cytochrome (tetrathionate reductase family)
MKAKHLAALRAALFHAVVITLCLLLVPAVGSAASRATGDSDLAGRVDRNKVGKVDRNKVGRVDLNKSGPIMPVGPITPEEYIEYASINDEDIHELYFGVVLYEGTESCLLCHQKEGQAALEMGHFKWEGKSNRVAGLEGKTLGKTNLLNNFCIAIPTNEGRCTQCHAGIGFKDDTFNFDDPRNVDCLICHDQSGTYAKDIKTAGAPVPGIDLNKVAQSIALGSDPQRKNCINCHARAGGGDNVKHGDLSTDLEATTREYDVHMGTDGADFRCTACHGANHDPKSGAVNHGNAGMSLHSVNEGEMKQCADCHGTQNTIHADTPANQLFEAGWHKRLACQVCHIPAIARKKPTKVEWYWSDAGQTVDPIPKDPVTGKETYDKKKGTFVWANNVRPVLRYSNGTWNRKVINMNDSYDEEPIDLGSPLGDYTDPDAMIYPFKLMIGNQPVDTVNSTVMVPHLFGMAGGPNPYWGKFNWDLALQDGSAYTGQPYSGTYGFAATEMLLSVNHEIAPAEKALGNGPVPDNCASCHHSEYVDWDELGWTDDPLNGGDRVGAESAAAAAE